MKKICSSAGLRRGQPQLDLADPAGDEVDRVENRVHAIGEQRRMNGASPIPSIWTSSWLSASPAAHPTHHAREDVRFWIPGGLRDQRWERGPRSSARSANRRSRHARVSRIRSPVGVSEPHGPEEAVVLEALAADAKAAGGHPGHARGAGAEACAAHPDRVDLVDEHDALAAPLARQLLGLADQEHHDDHVDADECRGEAGAGDRHEWAVEVGRDRLGEHRLAGAGRAQEQQPALALAAGLLELLARLPEPHHTGHFLLGLGLAAHVVHLDAPARVAGLVATDLPEVGRQQRSEQDQHVAEEQDDEAEREARDQAADRCRGTWKIDGDARRTSSCAGRAR